MSTPEMIIQRAQATGDRRSAVYWRGALDALRFRLQGGRIQCPYEAGSVEFDAYFAGNERGHHLWRVEQSREFALALTAQVAA